MIRTLQVLNGLLVVVMVGFGLLWMFDPASTQQMMGIGARNLVGMSTLRGDIAGMFLAAGLMLAAGLWTRNTAWFLAVALLMCAIMLGRLVGLVMDGVSSMAIQNLVSEAVIVAITLGAHRKLGRQQG